MTFERFWYFLLTVFVGLIFIRAHKDYQGWRQENVPLKQVLDEREMVGVELSVIVNYGMSLDDLLEEMNFKVIHKDIVKAEFSLDQNVSQKEVICKLFYYQQRTSFMVIVHEMEQRGYRPANILELNAFAKAYPEFQNRGALISLVAATNPESKTGRLRYPILWIKSRNLLLCHDIESRECDYFVGVKK